MLKPPTTFSNLPLTVDLLFESSPDCAKVLDMQGNVLSMNKNGQCLMEVDDLAQICGAPWPSLWPEGTHIKIEAALEEARQGRLGQFVALCPTAKGTPKWWDVRVTPIHDGDGQLHGFLSVSRDITALKKLLDERTRTESFSQGQKTALEHAVAGAPLPEVLDTLARTAEAYSDGVMLASVLLADDAGEQLHLGAAPSLPGTYNHAIAGMKIGPMAGCCGTAAYRKEPVFVRNIAIDPLWSNFRELAAVHGLGSCWSYPILSSGGRLLGTFAFYYQDVRDPTVLEREAMPVLVHTAALVMERHRETQERMVAEAALLEARTRLEATLAAGEVATWIYDVQADRVMGDRNFKEILQISLNVSAGVPNDVCWKVVHPDDVHTVKTLLQRAIETGQPYEATYRIRGKEGQYRHVIARGKVQYGQDGRPTLLPGVVLDVTQQKQAEEELRRLAAKLSETNRRKTEFLATLAHELRNPLAPIRNGLEVMRLAGSNPAAATKVQEMMHRQVDHMVHLIDDLLDMARIDSGKIDLRKARVDLKTIAASAVEASLPMIDAAEHVLEMHIPNEPMLMEADATRLSQVLTNLLSNSAKYTPKGGRIEIVARRDNQDVVISVSDTGIGIPATALGTIFDMFSQVERSHGRSQGGLGIGLSLVNRLVQMHGGSVVAESPGEGKGSTFILRLPLVEEGCADEATSHHQDAAIGEARTKSLRIVVADDNADAADSMATLLRLAGHTVAVATDGYEALKLVRDQHPEIVFLDIGMPGLTGYEVAMLVRKSSGLEGAMLVALTGWGAEHDRARAGEVGFDHHLTKPADIRAIDRVLQSYQSTPAG